MDTVDMRAAGGETAIRPARDADLEALVAIYNHYVLNTVITFDVDAFSVDARRGWFGQFSADGIHRLLVADDGGAVIGYASSAVFKPRAAYRTSVETTVYLHPDATGRGVGRQLYGELLSQLRALPDLHRAYAGIALPNPASVALHERLGFTPAGLFREVGHKFGRFWDVAWYERDLSS